MIRFCYNINIRELYPVFCVVQIIEVREISEFYGGSFYGRR